MGGLPCLAGSSNQSFQGQARPCQEKEDLIHPRRGTEGSSRTGQAACSGDSCVPCLLGQATTLPPLLLESSSFLLILPHWDTILVGSKKLCIKSSPGHIKGLRHFRAQKQGTVEPWRHGDPWDTAIRVLANLALWEEHHTRENKQLSCQWGW